MEINFICHLTFAGARPYEPRKPSVYYLYYYNKLHTSVHSAQTRFRHAYTMDLDPLHTAPRGQGVAVYYMGADYGAGPRWINFPQHGGTLYGRLDTNYSQGGRPHIQSAEYRPAMPICSLATIEWVLTPTTVLVNPYTGYPAAKDRLFGVYSLVPNICGRSNKPLARQNI